MHVHVGGGGEWGTRNLFGILYIQVVVGGGTISRGLERIDTEFRQTFPEPCRLELGFFAMGCNERGMGGGTGSREGVGGGYDAVNRVVGCSFYNYNLILYVFFGMGWGFVWRAQQWYQVSISPDQNETRNRKTLFFFLTPPVSTRLGELCQLRPRKATRNDTKNPVSCWGFMGVWITTYDDRGGWEGNAGVVCGKKGG